MKNMADVIAEAIDFARHQMDRAVVARDLEEGQCVKLDGWIDAHDIKRAYHAIVNYEKELNQ